MLRFSFSALFFVTMIVPTAQAKEVTITGQAAQEFLSQFVGTFVVNGPVVTKVGDGAICWVRAQEVRCTLDDRIHPNHPRASQESM